MIIPKKNKKTNNKCQRKFKIKIRYIICIIISFFTYTSFRKYDDLRYYKEELSYDIPDSLEIESIYEENFDKNIYIHHYNKNQINYIKHQINFESMRNLLVEYYIKYKFISASSKDNIELPDKIKSLLENKNNLYYYHEDLCDKALLILDTENNHIYNFYNTCRG